MKKIFILIITSFLILLTSCNEEIKENTKIIYALDTSISVTIYSNDKETTTKHLNEINNIYLQYSKLADNYKSYESVENIYDLNENRSIIALEELIELLNYSLEMKDITNGYFNPFIGRLSMKWKNALFKDNPHVLNDDEINTELNKIASSSLLIEGNNVSIVGDGDIDLGALAKGYATQKAKEYLDLNDIKNYIINAGSSNVLLGEKTDGKEFKVGIEKVFYEGYYEVLNVKNKAVVNSSVKNQHVYINGVLYHHLINPHTGYPANFYESIVVVGDDSGYLDALSTALFVMDLDILENFIQDTNLEIYAFKGNKLMDLGTHNEKI